MQLARLYCYHRFLLPPVSLLHGVLRLVPIAVELNTDLSTMQFRPNA